jgi:hypothetical protein
VSTGRGKTSYVSRLWWFTAVIPALRRLRQEDGELQASLGYTVRPYLQKRERERRRKEKKLCMTSEKREKKVFKYII